jgi:hypothetical protein
MNDNVLLHSKGRIYAIQPQECSDLFPNGNGINGEYKLYVGGQSDVPVSIYCYFKDDNHTGSPHVTLHHENYSKYERRRQGGGCGPIENNRYSFSKVLLYGTKVINT